EMALDERNFRSAYYEKVGFRSVEEKKTLDMLLKDKSLDMGKLKQFCLRFSVPPTHRKLLWKLLLGVLPMYVECHTFVIKQRQQEYEDLLRALEIMRVVDANTSKPQLFLAMWLLQSGRLHFESNLKMESSFIPITQSLMQFFDDNVDIYWVSKCFYDNISKFEGDIPKLIESAWSLLEKEDFALYEQLYSAQIINNFPLRQWFSCCFAGILNENALGKIWDKICGGSYKILVFVVVVLFTNQRHKLMKVQNVEKAVECLSQISEETSEIIANKSIEMLQQHTQHIVYDKLKPTST
ncbi:GTPase activator protein, partial [Oryctes borbonicus]